MAQGLARGAPDAYDRLYEAVADRLYAFAYRFLDDQQDAEDAVQQAFLELAQTSRSRDGEVPTGGRSLEAWLFASVRFTCIDIVRRRARRPEVPHDRVPEVGDAVEDETRYAIGLDPALERALSQLTPEQRQLIHLRFVEGLDGQQIADIMDSNRVAVYAMGARAQRRLKNLLTRIEAARSPERKGLNDG